MFVVSVKTSKKQLLLVAGLAVVLIVAIICCVSGSRNAVSASAEYEKAAATDAERKAFLAQYGWTVAADPVEICEVIIPEEFNAVYTEYNALQKQQGFDLSRFQGKRVKRWTYELTNYPDAPENTRVYVDLLIYDGRVIGGNVGTREADGFMQGFRRNSEPVQLGTSSVASSASPESGTSSGNTASGGSASSGVASSGAASSG